jgi:hypothetical protein
VIGSTEKILSALELEEVVTVFEKRYLRCLGDKGRCSYAVTITVLRLTVFPVIYDGLGF